MVSETSILGPVRQQPLPSMGDLITIYEGFDHISAGNDRISAVIDQIYEMVLELTDRMKVLTPIWVTHAGRG